MRPRSRHRARSIASSRRGHPARSPRSGPGRSRRAGPSRRSRADCRRPGRRLQMPGTDWGETVPRVTRASGRRGARIARRSKAGSAGPSAWSSTTRSSPPSPSKSPNSRGNVGTLGHGPPLRFLEWSIPDHVSVAPRYAGQVGPAGTLIARGPAPAARTGHWCRTMRSIGPRGSQARRSMLAISE